MSDQHGSSSDEQHIFEIEDAQTKYDFYSFDRYNIERSLGSGAMATVLLATDKVLNRKVALKVPLIKSDKSTEIIEKRFLREAQAAARLSHPNICQIHEVGLADGTYYISMAYIEGSPLNQIIQESDRFEEIEAARIVGKIASGIAEAHRQGFVHRDLKPNNVMIDRRGEPIVLDFGLARFFDNSQLNQTLTLTGQTVGTPAYMSPEQALGSRDLTPTSDVFSLGVILWEMLCGERPFTGDMMEMLNQIVRGPSPSPRTKRAEVSEAMEAICLKAIANKPEDRFQSMEEFGQALDDLLHGRKIMIDLPGPKTRVDSGVPLIEPEVKTRAESAARSAQSARPAVWVWGVIGLLLLVIVGFMVRPMFTQPRQPARNSGYNPANQIEIDLSPEVVFPAGDKNEDGLLSADELPAFVINRADVDGDGNLSFQELTDKYQELGETLYDTHDGRPPPLNSLEDLFMDRSPPGYGGSGRGPEGGFGRRPPPGPPSR